MCVSNLSLGEKLLCSRLLTVAVNSVERLIPPGTGSIFLLIVPLCARGNMLEVVIPKLPLSYLNMGGSLVGSMPSVDRRDRGTFWVHGVTTTMGGWNWLSDCLDHFWSIFFSCVFKTVSVYYKSHTCCKKGSASYLSTSNGSLLSNTVLQLSESS